VAHIENKLVGFRRQQLQIGLKRSLHFFVVDMGLAHLDELLLHSHVLGPLSVSHVNQVVDAGNQDVDINSERNGYDPLNEHSALS
jgi:hypothetical protein